MFGDDIQFWHWLAAGFGLLVIEVFLPGVVMMWFGLGALVVGLVLLLIPTLGFELQLLIFAVVSVATLVVGRAYVAKRLRAEDHPKLSRRGAQMIGQVLILDEKTQRGRGRQRVADSTWTIAVDPPSGDDLPKGAKVEVVAVKGVTLQVKAVE